MKKLYSKKTDLISRLPFFKRLSTNFLFTFIAMTILITASVCLFLYEMVLNSAEEVRKVLANKVASSLATCLTPETLRDLTAMEACDLDILTHSEMYEQAETENDYFKFSRHLSGFYAYEHFSSTAQTQPNAQFISSICMFCCPKDNPEHRYLGLFNQVQEKSILKPSGYSFHQEGILNEQMQNIITELEKTEKQNLSINEYIEKEELDFSKNASNLSQNISQLYQYAASSDYMIQKSYACKFSSGFPTSTLIYAVKLEDFLVDIDNSSFKYSSLIEDTENLEEDTKAFYQPESTMNYYLLVELPIDTKAHILLITFIVFGILIFFMLILHFLLRRKILTPLEVLAVHMDSYVEKREGCYIPLKEQPVKNELSIVNNSLLKMENDIRDYIENLAQTTKSKDVMRAEIDVAREIQQNLFPCHFPAFPERQDFDIFVKQSAKNYTGGDFYNFFLLDSSHLVLYVGNTSGSGIPTSMFSVIAFTLLQNFASTSRSPELILANTNNTLSENNNASLSVNVFLGIIDLAAGIMSYATAGNPQMYIKHPGSDFELMPPQNCFPLANIEQVRYTGSTVTFSQSDMLFVHTPGVSEAVNPQGMSFGSDYVLSSINQLVNRTFLLNEILETLEGQISEFTGDTPQTFDRTLLLFRYLGK